MLARSLLPYLNTASRLVASGIATGAALSLFFLMLNAQPRRSSRANTSLWASAGLALAVSLSVLLRTIYYGLDYSLTPSGGGRISWASCSPACSFNWNRAVNRAKRKKLAASRLPSWGYSSF